MILPLKPDPASQAEAMDAVRAFLQSARVLPMTGEQDWEATLTADKEASLAALQSDASDIAAYMQYVYALALLRNIRYGLKSRGSLLALGANNAFRELYEKSKQGKDANLQLA